MIVRIMRVCATLNLTRVVVVGIVLSDEIYRTFGNGNSGDA